MAIKTISLTEWLAANPTVVSNAIKDDFLKIAKNDMVDLMNKNLTALGDGVFIGKMQREERGSYLRMEEWNRTNIGITQADADAIVVQYGGYRLGIALDEVTRQWGSSTTVEVNSSQDLNSYDGKARTAAIMANAAFASDSPDTYAVAYAYAYSKGHTGDVGGDSVIAAKSWWLPTMGDLALIHDHFNTINLAIARINAAGKQRAVPLNRADYWSCVENGAASARHLYFGIGGRGGNGRGVSARVRPVTAF
jgi:hypothetical protein